LAVSPAVDQVIIYQPARLHMSIHDRASHKFEPALGQIPAERIGFGADCRHLRRVFPTVNNWLGAHKRPDVMIERSELLLDLQKAFCVVDGGVYLESIADDSWILEYLLEPGWRESRHAHRVKVGKLLAVTAAF